MWLGKLSDEMKRTLQELLVECVNDGHKGGGGVNPVRYPSQVLCLGEQVLFTERCEQAIQRSSLAELVIELESQLDSYTSTEIQVCGGRGGREGGREGGEGRGGEGRGGEGRGGEGRGGEGRGGEGRGGEGEGGGRRGGEGRGGEGRGGGGEGGREGRGGEGRGKEGGRGGEGRGGGRRGEGGKEGGRMGKRGEVFSVGCRRTVLAP